MPKAIAGRPVAVRTGAPQSLPAPPAGKKPASSPRDGWLPGSSPSPSTRAYLDDPPKPTLPKNASFLDRAWEHIYEVGAHIVTYLKQPLMPTLAVNRGVVGYVVAPESRPNVDGDIDIDVAPLLAERDVLYFNGHYRPIPPAEDESQNPHLAPRAKALLEGGAVHCEVKTFNRQQLMPEITRLRQLSAEGKTPLVEISGRWTYDPFHEGWTEIHPVSDIRILADDYVKALPAKMLH